MDSLLKILDFPMIIKFTFLIIYGQNLKKKQKSSERFFVGERLIRSFKWKNQRSFGREPLWKKKRRRKVEVT